MKASGWLVLGAAVCALVIQGCAETGGVRPQVTATSQPAPAPTVQVALASGTAVPEENGKPVVKADSKQNFEAVVAAIRQQMQPGGRWQYIDANERATVDGSFADMSKLYDQYGSVDKMAASAKVRLLADQSTVNAILTKKDGERLICETNTPVGSHFPVKTCKTYAQIQAEQGRAQEFLRKRNDQNSQQGWNGH